MPYPFTKEQSLEWKKQLKDECINILQERIKVAEQAMNQAQEAANSEGKSSAGDKYETSRAMGQLDRDMNAKQLEEAKRDLEYINLLPVSTIHQSVTKGSVVMCEDFVFFIALGLGTRMHGRYKVIFLSSGAPVAVMLNGKKAGEQFVFNTKTVEIIDVF